MFFHSSFLETKTTSKPTYSDATDGDESTLQKKAYIEFTILKLKFTNLGYFLGLSDIFYGTKLLSKNW